VTQAPGKLAARGCWKNAHGCCRLLLRRLKIPLLFSLESRVTRFARWVAGLPDFYWYNIPTREKWTKITSKYTKCP
jgi:hypothetical protein